MKFTLPISPDYIAHWGLWEAVREIYQNALDEGGAALAYNYAAQRLEISSATGRLTPESLVLGTTSKKQCLTKRGKFGEGYKLALLVLARLKYKVVIQTGDEIWISKLEHDPTFNTTVLNIYTMPAKFIEGVRFYILDFADDHMSEIEANIRPEPNESDTILDDKGEAGRIYVGGLYVTTVKGYHCGYAFRPGTVKLDRDRGMVNGFDLAYETSRLWTDAEGSRVVELMRAEAPDVQYVEQHAQPISSVTLRSVDWFDRTYPHAVPVSTQDEIQRASTAGLKWVLVPEAVKNIIRLVKSWIIPNEKSLIERLREFGDRYKYHLPTDGRRALDEIIQSLEQ